MEIGLRLCAESAAVTTKLPGLVEASDVDKVASPVDRSRPHHRKVTANSPRKLSLELAAISFCSLR